MPNTSTTINDLLTALRDYDRAAAQHDKERDKAMESGAGTWGYYGYEYTRRLDEAALEVERQLNAVIDERVAIVVERMKNLGQL